MHAIFNTIGTNDVQHVTCHMVRSNSSAANFEIVFIDLYECHVDLCTATCFTARPSWRGKNFTVGQYRQYLQTMVFKPAMLTGAVVFNHFIPLSLTFTLPGGHKVSA